MVEMVVRVIARPLYVVAAAVAVQGVMALL